MIRRLERGSKEERERLSNDMSDTDDPYPHVDDIHDAEAKCCSCSSMVGQLPDREV